MSRSFKKISYFVSLLALSIGTPFIAHAFLAEGIAFVLLGVIIALLLGVSNIILMIAIWILQWVLSESFIDWGYTQNPIIDIGWGLTRDLGNMFFVIYLAFVGLATALRIDKYKTQKILPTLVLVALLVNFSPVICGVVVDASNILTGFFLSESGGGGWQAFATQVENLKNGILGGGLGQALNPIKIVGVYAQAIILVIFNIVAAGLYILFAFLFAARYIAIWLLVILSPLAFFSLAVPDLKSFWEKWWNMFIQWCFVGVTASFFLYLGHHMMVEADSMMGSVAPQEGVLGILTGGIIELLHFIIPYGIALGFLGIGFFAALSSSAKGANIVIKGAKLAGGAAKGAVKAQTWDRFITSNKGEDMGEGLTESPQRIRRLLSKKGRDEYREIWGEASVGKKVGMAIRTVAPFSGYAARPMREATVSGRDEIRKLREEYKKQYGKDPGALEVEAQTIPGRDWKRRMAATLAAGDVGGSQSLDSIEKNNPGQSGDILKMAGNRGMRKEIKDLVTMNPDLILETAEGEDELETLQGVFSDPIFSIDISDMSEKEKTEHMERIKNELPEASKTIVENLIRRGLDDENVTELIDAGYNAGEAVVAAVFKQVVEGIKDMSDVGDATAKNPLFQRMGARYGGLKFARGMLDKGGDVRTQFIDSTNEIGAEKLMKTNDGLVRWGLLSMEGRSRMGPIQGAETKPEYKLLRNIGNMNQQELREMSREIQVEINTMTTEIQKEINKVQKEINETRKTMDTMSKDQKKDAELYIGKLETQEADLKSKQSPRHNQDIARLEKKMDILKRHLRPTGKPKEESEKEKEERLRVGKKTHKERNP